MYVTEAFKKTHTTFKALDIVINNAGILDDSRWELEIAINVVSTQH
jgi:NAD(P)-dependent dehydrogenase (short-subunit alcohol dehydrogenase family)